MPPGILGALAGLAVLAAAGILASAYLFWQLKRVTWFSRPPDEGPRPGMEALRPFRVEATAPSATITTDDIYYPYSNFSISVVSPLTNDRSATSYTGGIYTSTASASTSNRITQADPPGYEEGVFSEQGAMHTQSRRGNAKSRSV